ncbi:zinc finger protein 541 [Rana temporaria]|uniref:zinc finger protein 541 n=1 Tax=Rana temporaria TaxID=8407 RepID=UPI001AAD2CBC|nr:zinc finger protein 541 [Rana temporaria]
MMEMSDLGASLPSGSVDEKNPSLYKVKRAKRRLLQDVPKGHSTYRKSKLSPQAPKPSKGMMKDPGGLVMPVSVPVTVIDHHEDNKVNERGDHLQDPNTKKRKRPLPKPLYIPPPLLDVKSSPTGCFRSNLRSLNTDLYEDFRYPTYIPPPMLSPIRPGSGLYFNTFCSPSSATGPNFSFPEKETSPCEILPVKDSMVFTTQPHVNIGNQFQADIPEIQDPCSLGDSKADLVWKPLKMTKSVTNFLHLACSSAVPGGGNNLEFALHCLHLSRGNTMEALDKLLIQDPQTYFPQYLADYHYAGSCYWSDSEKQLFRKAYRNNRKEFSYIQAMIPKKNIYQCVEYYYTWKKHIKFEKRGSSAAENTSSLDGRESECNKNDGLSGNKTTVFRTGYERDATLQLTGRHQKGKKKSL